ncbi:MAG: hypothetical protein SGJ17_01990, partial [Hyphomicrobiales bacterium]|nr:hypothetical protein [Hyphomicrobiales bacterium]
MPPLSKAMKHQKSARASIILPQRRSHGFLPLPPAHDPEKWFAVFRLDHTPDKTAAFLAQRQQSLSTTVLRYRCDPEVCGPIVCCSRIAIAAAIGA